MSIASVMENADSRLEEVGRNYINFGDLTFHKYYDRIDSVTASSINSTASKVLGGKPTLLVTGGAINLVPSVTDQANGFQPLFVPMIIGWLINTSWCGHRT